MRKHLLVTNDFPPKVGGIQNYLYELWSRLPANDFTVLTPDYPGAAKFDSQQKFEIVRSPQKVLLPTQSLARTINSLAKRTESELVVLDPVLPLGLVARKIVVPYGMIIHGAEIAIPSRVPGVSTLLRGLLSDAEMVLAAGEYSLAEVERCVGKELPATVITPGVDCSRFSAGSKAKSELRLELGIKESEFVVASVNRLVPRKGLDILIKAAAEVASSSVGRPLRVVIGGEGRKMGQLKRIAARAEKSVNKHADLPRLSVQFLGNLPDDGVVDLYHAADVMAMLCRNRWFGLEQEGFGIAFLEAAASSIPQIAGRSGGSAEAVANRKSGIVIDEPNNPGAVAKALIELINSPQLVHRLGSGARTRAEQQFDHDLLATRLEQFLSGDAPKTPLDRRLK